MFEKRLIKEIPQAQRYVFMTIICQWIALMMNIAITMTFCLLFTKLLEETLNVSYVMTSICGFIVFWIVRSYCLKKGQMYSFEGASLVKRTLRHRLFKKVLSLSTYYQKYVQTSELVQLSSEGINQLETYYSLYLPQLFYSLLAPLTLFIICLLFDWKAAIILLICVPLIPLSIIVVQKLAKKLLSQYWTSYTTLGDSFLENLQGLTTLKIYQSDAYKHKQMNQEAENFRKITMRVLIMQLNSITIMDMIAYGGGALGSFFAIMHLCAGETSVFGCLFFILISFEFFVPLRQLGSYFHIAMNGIAASEKIFRILDIKQPYVGQEVLDENNIYLSCHHLSFYYGDRCVLNNIDFDIQPHQWIGVVGKSGSGKSTLAKVIMGSIDGYQGNLIIQGKERSDIKHQSFLSHFTYMTQDSFVFKATVRKNLDYLGKYSDRRIYEVLKLVDLYDYFIKRDGLDTELNESGSQLSGGQKQRLNLARAILEDSDVYIFDEATSQIDRESEEKILEVIQTLAQYKTVIMITHRMSNVKNCDQIFVMKDGKLIEQGRHFELYLKQNEYYRLTESQRELEVL